MNWITILAIIGGVIGFVVILAIVLYVLSNKKKAQNLDKVLKEYKQENQKLDNPSVDLKEEPVFTENEYKQDTQPVIEDYTDLDIWGTNEDNQTSSEPENNEDEDIDWKNFSFIDDDDEKDKNKKKLTKKNLSQDEHQYDFEEFLDQYSYTRKIIDKDLLKKLNSLPPEIKEIILGNVFNKYDE